MTDRKVSSIVHFLKLPIIRYARVAQFFLAVAIFTYAALAPGNQLDTGGISDIYLHFLGNLLLFVSAWLACLGRLRLGLLLIFLVAYSLLIESGQWLAPERSVEIKDMLVNISGLAAGLIITYVLEWLFRDHQFVEQPKTKKLEE